MMNYYKSNNFSSLFLNPTGKIKIIYLNLFTNIENNVLGSKGTWMQEDLDLRWSASAGKAL